MDNFYRLNFAEFSLAHKLQNNYPLDDEQIVISKGKENLPLTSLCKLKKQQWINDDIVNAYVELLKQSGNSFKVMNSYFFHEFQNKYPNINKITRILYKNKVNVQSSSLIIPCNLGFCHWCFFEVNFSTRSIIIYDSMQQFIDDEEIYNKLSSIFLKLS